MKDRIVEGLIHLFTITAVTAIIVLAVCVPTGCAADGRSCTVEDGPDGFIVTCTDGTEAVLRDGDPGTPGDDGTDGTDGKSCTVNKDPDGTVILVCTDGTAASVTSLSGEKGDPGEPGAPGASGLSSLINTTNEPQGQNCSFGGTHIDAGVDTNANGILDQNEVNNTTYVCHATGAATGILYGDINIRNYRDYLTYAQYERITGKLSVNARAGDMEFHSLTHVGEITIYSGDPNLQTAISFPVLVEAGNFRISGDSNADYPGVVSLSAPLLETVGQLNVASRVLQFLDLGSVRVVGQLAFSRLNALDSFDLHSLESAAFIRITDCPLLTCAETEWLCSIAPAGACTIEAFDQNIQDYVSCL